MRPLVRIVCWLALLGPYFTPAFGQEAGAAVRMSRTTAVFSFPQGLDVYADSSGRVMLPQLRAAPRRYPFGRSGWPVPVAGPAPHWMRFAVFNAESRPLPLLVEIDHPFLEELNAWVVAQHGAVRPLPPLSWRTPFAQRPTPHRNFVLPVTMPPRQVSTVYLRLDKSEGTHRFPIRLWQPDAFQKHDLADSAFWGLAMGWLLFAIVLGLFLFAIGREAVYAHYSFYIAAHLCALLVNEGLLGEYYLLEGQRLTGNDLGDVCIGLIIGSNILFVRTLLNVRAYIPAWLYRLSDGFLVVWVGWMLGYFIVPWLPAEAAGGLKQGLYVGKYVVHFVGGSFAEGFIVHALFRRPTSRQARTYLVAFLPVLVVANVFFYGNFVHSPRFASVQMQAYAVAIVFETVVLLLGLAYRFKTYRDERERLLRAQNQAERAAYQAALQAQQQERQRLAKELHDGTGLDLAVLKFRMSNALETPVTAAGDWEECLREIDKICTDLRQVSHALLPTDLEQQGLVPSLQRLVGQVASLREGLEIHFTHGLERDLPEPIGRSVYQTTKELLNNALKHAGASVVDVELYQQNGHLCLTVSDDGRGYDPARLNVGDGIGLRNIRAGAEALRGEFEIIGKPSGGMLHRVKLPWDEG